MMRKCFIKEPCYSYLVKSIIAPTLCLVNPGFSFFKISRVYGMVKTVPQLTRLGGFLWVKNLTGKKLPAVAMSAKATEHHAPPIHICLCLAWLFNDLWPSTK